MDWQTVILAMISGGAMGVLTAAVNAWFARRKTAAEADDTAAAALLKKRQADVSAVEPWKELVDQLQDQVDRQDARSKRQDEEIARLSEVATALRVVTEDRDRSVKENITLRAEVTDLRTKVQHLTDQLSERDDLIRRLQAQVIMLTERVKDLEKKSTGPLSAAP